MRLVLAVFLLAAACGPNRAAGPAWPKQADPETDGGESLAPRAKASAVAAAADDDDDVDLVLAPAEKTETKSDAKPETPKAATPSTSASPPEDVIIEEIVIEIDD